MRFIFDIDGTVIDSSHRQGDTLDDWRRMNTSDNIGKDSTLPLFDQMRDAINEGQDVIICTSRVMGDADFRWLTDHGIDPLRGIPVLCRDSSDNRHCGFSNYPCFTTTRNRWAWHGGGSLETVSCLMMIRAYRTRSNLLDFALLILYTTT